MEKGKVLLEVRDLTVEYPSERESVIAVNKGSFAIKEGRILGIMGESGSGKTSIALAILQLHNQKTRVEGSIRFRGEEIMDMNSKALNKLRWKKVSLVYQNHLDVLNPVLSIKEQILEGIKRHLHLNRKQQKEKLKELCKKVGLQEKWMEAYPHQLSGGMRQRVLIAMALSCDPELLIVDEPTTALDAMGKEEILDLLQELHRRENFSMLLISHDIYVMNKLSHNIMIMYEGRVLEKGITKEVLENPMHVYTRGLLHASVDMNPYQDLWGVPQVTREKELAGKELEKGGCVFRERCCQQEKICAIRQPELEYVAIERQVACNFQGIKTLLRAVNIHKSYSVKKEKVVGCKDCSISIRSGEIVALIGASGSGKTTFANILSGMLRRDSGVVEFEGESLQGNNFIRRKNGVQMVFQDPFSATNGRFTLLEVLLEPLNLLGEDTEEQKRDAAKRLLESVGLSTKEDFMSRRCSSLSGGQRQRLALARGLIMEPKLLIADEISSMLDPSTKANVLRLLKGLQNQYGFAMLYITHDLALARKISNKVCIMYRGEIVESGSVQKVFTDPKTSYAKALLKNLPSIDVGGER
ncbi:ABC transporter ATP-binding protein [Isachenkonia alkalipeptolytica]|uniref:ABC transporter ATP-binding protein n=1 Tax=Isachenkonia alkalipeptolytica TaxID=2565777 RepID=A0AA44BDM7_9CLOT|nr:ABC transporter ATP-binding protein [Isachenkonia alkalipeptolytica]